jgi:hypothetical protein
MRQFSVSAMNSLPVASTNTSLLVLREAEVAGMPSAP